MQCFELKDGIFVSASDPVNSIDEKEDYFQALARIGYLHELTSLPGTDWDPEVTLYSNNKSEVPRFYIDISGRTGQIAVLLARDFPGLVAVLKEIGPLMTLFSLDQRGNIFSINREAQHPSNY